MPEYTLLAVLSVLVVVALERWRWRTGVLRTRRYWMAMAIVLAFQVLVDGILTRLDDPVVNYAEHQTLGIRAPWDIPVEDFAFGWSMVTATILLWHRRTTDAQPPRRGAPR